MQVFTDRRTAGRELAQHLQHLKGPEVVVLGLPRGGVPVAYEVARALEAPLDVILVRKLGVPYQPELAMGALGEDGVRVLDPEVMRKARVSRKSLDHVEQVEAAELARRARTFRGGRRRQPLKGKLALIVDDGIATGSTARAAAEVARAEGANRVIVATPVAPPGIEGRLAGAADEIVVVTQPEPFFAIGEFYDDFSQTTDEEVNQLLRRARGDG